MIRLLIAVFAMSIAAPVLATPNNSRFTYRPAGFSIEPLSGDPSATNWQIVMMFLPPSEGFAPNVNVLIQPNDKPIDHYIAITLAELKQMGMAVVGSKKVNETIAQFEYTGRLNGRDLHFYAKAFKKGDQVYLVTATSKKTQWAAHADELKRCVDSFKLE